MVNLWVTCFPHLVCNSRIVSTALHLFQTRTKSEWKSIQKDANNTNFIFQVKLGSPGKLPLKLRDIYIYMLLDKFLTSLYNFSSGSGHSVLTSLTGLSSHSVTCKMVCIKAANSVVILCGVDSGKFSWKWSCNLHFLLSWYKFEWEDCGFLQYQKPA